MFPRSVWEDLVLDRKRELKRTLAQERVARVVKSYEQVAYHARKRKRSSGDYRFRLLKACCSLVWYMSVLSNLYYPVYRFSMVSVVDEVFPICNDIYITLIHLHTYSHSRITSPGRSW